MKPSQAKTKNSYSGPRVSSVIYGSAINPLGFPSVTSGSLKKESPLFFLYNNMRKNKMEIC